MKKERNEIIHDALNFLDDEMIEEVENLRAGVEVQQSRPRPWRKWAALAASICLLVVIGGVWQGVQGESHNEHSNDVNMESAPDANYSDTNTNEENVNDTVDKESAVLENESSFYFSLTWGCNGISFYDSKTGKLIKTTDATIPEEYITYVSLSEKDRLHIYNLISAMDVKSYPDVYDPHVGEKSKPSMDLVLTVYMDGEEKTISAKNIAMSYVSVDDKGQIFLTTCKKIQDILMDTEEWKALPDYEFYYD